jgi:DNA mismatch endonuclease, patch repair protein
MSRQRTRDTAPELILRKRLHALGLRYRVSWPVPGIRRRSIDIAFTRARVAVFIDGCFWHGCPSHKNIPAANNAWWAAKLATNRARDAATGEHLQDLGWTVIRTWEHENMIEVADQIADLVRNRSGRSQ